MQIFKPESGLLAEEEERSVGDIRSLTAPTASVRTRQRRRSSISISRFGQVSLGHGVS